MGQTESKSVEWKPVERPAWNNDDMSILRRFLYLGTDSVYSPSHVEPEQEYADLINRLIKEERGKEVVQLIVEISYCGWAPRQNYIIFALAVCARSNDDETKKLAYNVLCQICRSPVHFFMFVNYCQLESGKSEPPSSGWGRAHRRAVLKWYEEKCKDPEGIARLLTKYKSRKMVANEGKGNRWSHRDIFRLGHPSSADSLMKVVRSFVLHGFQEAQKLASKETENNERVTKFLTYIEGTIRAKKCTEADEMVKLIEKYGLGKGHVPTALMNTESVWKALIENMKPEAKIRNICMISAKGFCAEDSEMEKEIKETITSADNLQQARVHPIRVLSELLTYKKGEEWTGRPRSRKKTKQWKVNENIVEAFNEAYELSFRGVSSTGKHVLLAVDVSQSMESPCKGCPSINCDQAAATMMMLTARTEKSCMIFWFSYDGLTRIHLNEKDTLSQIMEKMRKFRSEKAEKADSALPMLWAKENKKKIDAFIVYTDNIPTDRKIYPSKALEEYRTKMKIPEAKLIVVAMASSPYKFADPVKRVVTGFEKARTRDYREMSIVGFDVNAAILIAMFIQGEI